MCAISGENGLANHLKTWKTKKDRKGKLKESLLCKNLFFEVSQKKKKTALTVLVQYLQSIGLEIQQSDLLIFCYWAYELT